MFLIEPNNDLENCHKNEKNSAIKYNEKEKNSSVRWRKENCQLFCKNERSEKYLKLKIYEWKRKKVKPHPQLPSIKTTEQIFKFDPWKVSRLWPSFTLHALFFCENLRLKCADEIKWVKFDYERTFEGLNLFFGIYKILVNNFEFLKDV